MHKRWHDYALGSTPALCTQVRPMRGLPPCERGCCSRILQAWLLLTRTHLKAFLDTHVSPSSSPLSQLPAPTLSLTMLPAKGARAVTCAQTCRLQ